MRISGYEVSQLALLSRRHMTFRQRFLSSPYWQRSGSPPLHMLLYPTDLDSGTTPNLGRPGTCAAPGCRLVSDLPPPGPDFPAILDALDGRTTSSSYIASTAGMRSLFSSIRSILMSFRQFLNQGYFRASS